MKKNLILILLISCNAFAQQNKIDSLQKVLLTQKEDTNKVKTLNSLSWEFYAIGNYLDAIKYSNEVLSLSKKIKYRKGEASAYSSFGGIYYEQGNYSESLKYHSLSLKTSEEIENKKGVAASLSNIGLIYSAQGNYSEALKNYLSALKINEEMGNKDYACRNLNNIAIVYREQGNYPEALKNFLASLKIRDEIGDKYGSSGSYNNIGTIYSAQGNYSEALNNYRVALKIREEVGDKRGIAISYTCIGNAYYFQGNYDEALKNQFASLKVAEESGLKQTIADAYNNIAIVYVAQKDFNKGLEYHLASLKVKEELSDNAGIATSLGNIGQTYLKLNNYIQAKKYLEQALSLSKEIGFMAVIRDSYAAFSDLDSATNNWKDAYLHHKLFITYRDSLKNEENTKKLVQTQMQYDFDKKESLAKAEQEKKDAVALKEVQKQKIIRNSFMGAFTTVFVFAIVFFVQRNKISKERKRSDALLLNILPAETAKELKAKGSSDAKMFDDVTVMFTDFKDFTQVSEKLTPSELVAEIHYCFKAFDNTMTKFNIEKIKTIGDSYMAAGGLPVENKTNAEDTVLAALEIQKFMQQYKQERQNKNEEYFEIRIGVHTGPVVAGIVGIKKYSYDIWGDTVNIASRMESTCEPGKVNISESTYLLVKDKFPCTYRGKVEAKNKGEIDMYFVEAKG